CILCVASRLEYVRSCRGVSGTIPLAHHRSTLFPYTTLFRSCVSSRRESVGAERAAASSCRDGENRESRRAAADSARSAGRCRSRDRKSTRLNSSHSQISYAVFCLKKKNARQLGMTQKVTSVK